MANIILEHTIKAVFSKHVSLSRDEPGYISGYMTKDLLDYIESIVRKKYTHGQVENENVEWDLHPTRVNIGLAGVAAGKLGTFILTFDFPSGKPRIPSFETEVI